MDSQLPDVFSPERCARLHNELLAKAAEHDPSVRIERTLAARFLEIAPEFTQVPSLPDLPWYRFLSQLDTTASASAPAGTGSDGDVGLLTPLMYQPDPSTFWFDRAVFWFGRVDQEASFILLYGQNNGDSRMDGGLYIDIQSYRAVWHGGHFLSFPPFEEWVPLETVLQRSLDAWSTGKFFWDVQANTISMRNWTPHDVEQSVAAFDRLLSSIERRILGRDHESHSRLEPLDAELLAPFKMSAFAVAFLTAAKRPTFTFVAPGVRALTSSLLNDIYGVEAPESARRTHWLGDEDDWPTLILPGVDAVPPPSVGRSTITTNQDIASFDQNWGFGKFTVNRQSGLYTMPDTGNSDLARFVASTGSCSACEFRSPCRWGPHREPRLADVFNHWTALVEDGTWAVDAHGVSTDHSWFTAHASRAKLSPDNVSSI